MFKLFTVPLLGNRGTRRFVRKRQGWRILVLTGLGLMALLVFGFVPGCGSDSPPGGAVKGKDAKVVSKPKASQQQPAVSILTDTEGSGSKGNIKHQPVSRQIEVFPGVTQEELETKIEADQKKVISEKRALPGITKEALNAKIEADRKKVISENREALPGITKEALNAKIEADMERARQDPNSKFLLERGTRSN